MTTTVTPTSKSPQGIRTIAIPLTTVTLDPRLQPRQRMNEDLLREYADAMHRGDTFPPIRVIVDKENHHYLVDGWHRVKAAEWLKKADLPAEVSAGKFENAEDYVLTVNRTHGLRRTQADVQNAIRRALKTPRWVKRSDNWIGKHIGCSDKTVSTLRQHLESTSEIPKLKKLLGEDGKERLRPKPKPTPKPTTEWPVTARAPRSDTPATPQTPAADPATATPPATSTSLPTSESVSFSTSATDVATDLKDHVTAFITPLEAWLTGTLDRRAHYTDDQRRALEALLKDLWIRLDKLATQVDHARDAIMKAKKSA